MNKKRNQPKRNNQALLSVIIPAFNEERTIEEILNQVENSGVEGLEIIVVDDGSSDSTRDLLQKNKSRIDQLILRKKNGGKGAALRDGIAAARGMFSVIQDADLEYDPKDYPKLLQPLLDNRADAVFGSRFVGSSPHRVVYFWNYLANLGLTTLSNLFNNLNLTDMETGYKAFKTDLLQSLSLNENSFGIEPEITAKIAAKKARIYEVGIAYHGRTYDEGKKIGLPDFFTAVWVILSLGITNWLVPTEAYKNN